MKLSVNIMHLENRFGLKEAFRLCKEAGFDAVDYSLERMNDPSHPLNRENYLEKAKRIRAIADEIGLPITQTHAPFSFDKWKDTKVYEEFIYPAICRSIEISAILGAKVVVVHPLHHFVYKGHEDEIFEKNMEFYRSLIPLCEKNGIKVGIENMFQRELLRGQLSLDTCATIPDFLRYVDTLQSEYMIACLDVGHVGVPVEQTDEIWDFIHALGHDRLQALHIHDNNYRADQHLLPYLGKINWLKVTEALGQIDYQGDFTYEVTNFLPPEMDDEFTPTAIKYVADIGRHLCNLVDRNRPNH